MTDMQQDSTPSAASAKATESKNPLKKVLRNAMSIRGIFLLFCLTSIAVTAAVITSLLISSQQTSTNTLVAQLQDQLVSRTILDLDKFLARIQTSVEAGENDITHRNL